MIGVTLPGGAGAGPGPAQAALPAVVSAIFTAAVAAFLVVLDALAHVGLVGHPDSFSDILAGIGSAALFGVVPQLLQRGQLAATTAATTAAHKRLDEIGAPPAQDGQ